MFLSMLANVWSPCVVGVRSAASISGELFKLCWINQTCNVNVNMNNNCVERRHQMKLWLELKAWSWLAKMSSQALIMQIRNRNIKKKNIYLHVNKYQAMFDLQMHLGKGHFNFVLMRCCLEIVNYHNGEDSLTGAEWVSTSFSLN